jgi:ABC-2 type transport system permease protein
MKINKTLVILKRELKSRLMSKSFIIMTLLIPVFLLGIFGFQSFLLSYESDSGTKLLVVTQSSVLKNNLIREFDSLEFVKNGYYKIMFDESSSSQVEQYIKEKKEQLLGANLTGIIFITDSNLVDKKVQYYSTNPNNNTVFEKVKSPINRALVDYYFKDKQLSASEISFARKSVDFEGYRVTKGEKIEEEGYGNMIASFLFTFFLYFSLIMIGATLMRSVVEEKSSKIVEVLLSSINASDLMVGKIFGAAITGVIQMAIWNLPVIILLSTSWFTLPRDFALKMDPSYILFFLYNYFVSLITFLGLFAGVGAMFDNDQDTQSGMWPVMMLIMVPFFIAITLPNNPDNSIAQAASLIPFASLIVMPARMALISVPVWQILFSVVLNLVVMTGVFYLSGKIYRVGILMTGKKPNFSEILKWLKTKA